jgi:hypothetical protein
MKPLAPYFGNRLASVTKKNKTTRSRIGTEMEALESRILLSGIVADGTKSYKKLTYTDLEGDKVTISVTKGSFTILGTNGDSGNELFTVDKITLDSLASTSTLNIKVANIKASSNGDAFTEIGEITSAKTAMKSITLDGANVSNINLADTSLSGGIVIKATAANIIDRDNVAGTMKAIANVNLNNVSVQSVATIQAATQGYGVGNGLNFNGAITVDAGATSIIGRTSQVNGSVNCVTIGNINVGGFAAGAQVTTTGDLTLLVSNGASLGAATFNVGKNLHLGVLSGGLNGADFNVTGSISGANAASTTDVVSINGVIAAGTNFNTDSTFAGISVSGGDAAFTIGTVKAASVASIGDITVSQGSLTSVIAASGNIGNISVRDEITGSITSTAGAIGTISADNVTGAIAADTTIGAITLDGANATGNITAGTSIASISAVGAVGNITATDASIGAISAESTGNITAETTISTITAEYIGNVTAGTSVGNLNITSNNAGVAIGNITVGTAASASAAQSGGSIGNITAAGDVGVVTAHNGGIGDILITDGSLGNVTAGSANDSGGHGFAGSGGNIGTITITADSAAVALETLGNVNAYNGNIGAILLTNASLPGTINSGSAATGSLALIGGNVGNITVNNTLGAATAGATSITSLNGTIGNIALSNSAASSSVVAHNLTIDAVSTVGNVSMSATGALSKGISAGTTLITGTAIGNVSVTGTGDSTTDAIANAGTLTIGDKAAGTAGTASIGNVTVNGTPGTVNLYGRAVGSGVFGGTVGNISITTGDFNTDTFTISYDQIRTIGNISLVGDSSDTLALSATVSDTTSYLTAIGNLSSDGDVNLTGLTAAKLTTIGNVSIDDQLLAGNTTLSKLTTVGDFSVDNFTNAAADILIGDGTGSIGYITIGDDAITAGGVTALFDFSDFDGVTGASTTVVAQVGDGASPIVYANVTGTNINGAAPYAEGDIEFQGI